MTLPRWIVRLIKPQPRLSSERPHWGDGTPRPPVTLPRTLLVDDARHVLTVSPKARTK